jgi:hypothetical protein
LIEINRAITPDRGNQNDSHIAHYILRATYCAASWNLQLLSSSRGSVNWFRRLSLVTEVLTLTPNQGAHLTTHKGFDLIPRNYPLSKEFVDKHGTASLS